MEDSTLTPKTEEVNELAVFTDDELVAKYDGAEEESEEFFQLKAELEKRGYHFEAAGESETDDIEIGDFTLAQADAPLLQNLRYSLLGSRLWEYLFLAIALAGATYFLIQVNASGMKINTRTAITTSLAVLIFTSTGVLVGVFRRMANMKDMAIKESPSGVYVILMFLWSLCILGGLYYTWKTFADVVKYSVKFAIAGAMIPLMGALVSFAFCTMFYILSKEV